MPGADMQCTNGCPCTRKVSKINGGGCSRCTDATGLGASVLTHAAPSLGRAKGLLLVGSDPAGLADRALATSVSLTGQSTVSQPC